jgi:hypothetical protein
LPLEDIRFSFTKAENPPDTCISPPPPPGCLLEKKFFKQKNKNFLKEKIYKKKSVRDFWGGRFY